MLILKFAFKHIIKKFITLISDAFDSGEFLESSEIFLPEDTRRKMFQLKILK